MKISLMRLPDVKAALGISRSSIYLQIQQGLFPRPIHIGPRMVAWPSTEVAAIINARIASQPENELAELVRVLEAMRKEPPF